MDKKQIIKLFEENFVEFTDSGVFINFHGKDDTDVYDWLSNKLDEVERSTAEEICVMIDNIELSYRDTTLEEWKAFKHIRNAIRDRFVLKNNK